MARRFGTITRDIIISPIGGVARLESIPEEPYKELLIAFAGPAVNVMIGIFTALITLLLFSGGIFPSNPSDFTFLKYPSEFIRYITLLNAMLFFFNLIPAFPMDGGRVLRSILAMGMSRYNATKIATFVGQGLAFIFIGIGIYKNQLFLGLIGLFVYFSAKSEFNNLRLLKRMKEISAESIMQTIFKTFLPTDRINEVLAYAHRTQEHNFLILDANDQLVGSIPHLVIREFKNLSTDELVENVMSTKLGTVSPDQSLYDIFNYLNNQGLSIVAVTKNNEILGIIDRDLITRIVNNGGVVPLKIH
jgi:Zn-dependent protease/predicted transcriptional regulator